MLVRVLGNILGDEAAANRKIDSLFDRRAVLVVCGDSQSVRMLQLRARRKHRGAFQEQVAALAKRNCLPSSKTDASRLADAGDGRPDLCGINGGRLIAR